MIITTHTNSWSDVWRPWPDLFQVSTGSAFESFLDEVLKCSVVQPGHLVVPAQADLLLFRTFFKNPRRVMGTVISVVSYPAKNSRGDSYTGFLIRVLWNCGVEEAYNPEMIPF